MCLTKKNINIRYVSHLFNIFKKKKKKTDKHLLIN